MAKKISVILLTLFVVFAVIGCKEDTPKAVAVTGVTLDETSIILDQGESKTLTATVAPNNATNKVVTWTSSDPSKVTVTEGIVTAVVGPATATITVTTEDGSKTATCSVTVNNPDDLPLSGTINISPSDATLVGTELTANYTGSETVTYQWKKDGSVVGTNSNKYTPTAVGNYIVTVSASGYNPKNSPAVNITTWVLYKDNAFTFSGGGIIANTTPVDDAGPNKVEFTFGADSGTDDCPVITECSSLTIKFTGVVNWGWGPQFQIGGNSIMNESSWKDVSEWSGNFDKFNADRTALTVDITEIVQLKKIFLASNGGDGGDLTVSKILEIIVSK